MTCAQRLAAAARRAPPRAEPRTPRRSRCPVRRSYTSGACSWRDGIPSGLRPGDPPSAACLPALDRRKRAAFGTPAPVHRLAPAVGVRTDFPRAVRRIDHTWIPLADGTRLAARIWLPEDAEQRSGAGASSSTCPTARATRSRAATPTTTPTSPATATRACASTCAARGDSDGIIEDEYLPQEQEDAIEVIAWLAEQPWCSGAVGMIGISWGGFNGLQVAARRPPALKAVISMCASDDRYADDVHYVGGCVLAVDMLPWAATMLTGNALPPDPAVGRRRLARDVAAAASSARRRSSRPGSPTSAATTTGARARCARTTRRSRSRCTRSAAGPTATATPIPRLIEGLPGPRKGLIGPWSHAFPQDGEPGPAIGFLQECLRWFDQHLKGIETGIMDEPRLRAVDAGAGARRPRHHAQRPGRWVSEPAWPPPQAAGVDAGTSRPSSRSRTAASSRPASTPARGAPDGGEGDWPGDQRAEDERSLDLHLGAARASRSRSSASPRSRSTIEVDRPSALVAVRLCDVDPDGASLLVTRGVLNLNHRDGHDDAAAARARPPLRRARSASTPSPSACPPATACASRVSTVVLAVGVARRRAGHAHAARRPAARCPTRAAARRAAAPTSARPSGPRRWRSRRSSPGRTNRTHDHDLATGAHELRFEWDVGGHRRLVDSGDRDGRHPRHDLPHRRRRPALGQRARAVQLGARPRRRGARASTPTAR